MKILFIVGRKKTGKTTLIEKLLSGLKEQGYRLGSIKHTSHDHQFDREGSDSFRHAQAGAGTTLLISPNTIACFSRDLRKRKLDELCDYLFRDCNLVIGEGFKGSPYPKIEVLGEDAESVPTCSEQDNLIAIVGNKKTGLPVPHFSIDQVEEIIGFIRKKFLDKDTDRVSD